jgi:hypothetical protein
VSVKCKVQYIDSIASVVNYQLLIFSLQSLIDLWHGAVITLWVQHVYIVRGKITVSTPLLYVSTVPTNEFVCIWIV